MFLLELVMQGVRGFRDLSRLRFQHGFNLVIAGNEAGKTASVDTVQRMLFPDAQAEGMRTLVSRQTPDASRGALVLSSDQGTYYRVIQDLSKGAVNLSEYSAAAKEFKLMHRDWNSAAQFMSGLTSGMSEAEYAGLFIMKREHGECRTIAAAEIASPEPAARYPDAAPSPRSVSPAQEARLAELRDALRKADQAGDAEYQLESAKIRLDEIAKKLDTLEEVNGRYADIEANIGDLKGCETLPENLSELLDAHEERQKEKMVKCDELQRDIASLNMQRESLPKKLLWQNKLFLAGVFLGIGSFILGLFVLTEEQADWFPIGVLVSLGLAAGGWYSSSRKNAQRRIIKKEIKQFEEDLAEAEKGFEEGGTAIMGYMKSTRSSTTAELRDKTDNYRYFSSTLLRDIANQRQHLLGGTSVEALRAEHEKIQQEVIELEKGVQSVSQYTVDTLSIQQEIERIEGESGGAGDFGSLGGGVDFSGTMDGPGTLPKAPTGSFLPELGIASRVGGIEMEILLPAVEAAAQRNLSAVTQGKYVRVDAGHDGDPVVTDREDRQVAFAELSHSTKKLLYFCLRTGLVEALTGKLSVPFILDDPLADFDSPRQQEACQILRALGAKTQVILFTSNPALRTESDTSATELK